MKDSFADGVAELQSLNESMHEVIYNTKTFVRSTSNVMQELGVSMPGEKTKGVNSFPSPWAVFMPFSILP